MPLDNSHPLQSLFQRYQQQKHGRQQDRIPCVLCGSQVPLGLELFAEHFSSAHGDVLEKELEPGQDAAAVSRKYYRRSQDPNIAGQKTDDTITLPSRRNNKVTTAPAKASVDVPPTPASPSASGISTQAVLARGTSPSSQINTEAAARHAASAADVADSARANQQNSAFWTGNKRGNRTSAPRLLQLQPHGQSAGPKRYDDPDNVNDMARQPETRPISQQQLVAEVRGIYTGLVLVESKCIEVDSAQTAQSTQKDGTTSDLNDEQWQALGALHRALLHEHHDFFLASQHPSASAPLKRLASKYSMPARLWRHGIHSYLELLRHRLPKSREHMLSYIYLAYDMMALLYETVPSYKETWIECLGDLGRYRMAIEEDDIQDRENWTEVSRQWYRQASDLSPGTGRLYHHLAILARPAWLQQLLYYSKSLCVPNPFESARESVLTLFEPLVSTDTGSHPSEVEQQPIDPPFVRSHACMFMRNRPQQQRSSADIFLGQLDNHIARTARLFLQPAYFIGIANCCAMVEYGSKSNVILRVIDPAPHENEDHDSEDDAAEEATALDAMGGVEGGSDQDASPAEEFLQARALAFETARLILNRLGDPNVWPFVHVTLVFIHHLTLFHLKGGMAYIENAFPWKPFVNLLNTLRSPQGSYSKYEKETFPGLALGERPLPEDFALRGLLWADRYHPDRWIEDAKIDQEDQYFELASMAEQRKDRILWLGCRIAKYERWILYDSKEHSFSVAPEFAGDEAEEEEDGMDVDVDVDDSGSDQTLGA